MSIPKEIPPPEPTLFAKLFGKKKSDPVHEPQSMIKQRKAPIKVEPKVFFANERTFLAWMHIAIILAGASIAILAFADQNDSPGSQIYGVIMLPVAVAFIVYAMYQCKFCLIMVFFNFISNMHKSSPFWQYHNFTDVRRAYMIRNKHPGPYEDTVGPTVLGIMLMLSIVCQFAIKLYAMTT